MVKHFSNSKHRYFFFPELVACAPSLRRRQWHPTPVLLPGKSHGRRSLVGCSPRPGRLQSMGSLRVRHDWETSLSLFISCIGEGNGNLLQCSCLENPRDGGAWWAAVFRVAQSQTRLKRLSSSSPFLICLLVSQFYSVFESETKSILEGSLWGDGWGVEVSSLGPWCLSFFPRNIVYCCLLTPCNGPCFLPGKFSSALKGQSFE